MKSFKPALTALLTSTVVFFASLSGQAQTDTTGTAAPAHSSLAIGLSIQPLFVMSNAIKFDLEFQKPTVRFGYVISPEIYGGNVHDTQASGSRSHYSPDRISGFGLGILQKLKFKQKLVSPYLAYGLTYRNQSIKYSTDGFVPYNEDGLSYYGYGPTENPIKINSLLISATIGLQSLHWDVLLTDIYLGFGYKLVDVEMEHPGERQYDDTFFSPAFKGPIMILGVKFGTHIKK